MPNKETKLKVQGTLRPFEVSKKQKKYGNFQNSKLRSIPSRGKPVKRVV